MNEALLEAFRHNGWATKRLLASCRGLSEEQLSSAAIGSFGGILATFNHLVMADGRYLWRLAGSGPAWAVDRDASADLDQVRARVEETEQLWEQFLSEPVDAERVIIVDEGARRVRAGVIVTQALHHGSAHREQICAILTGFGMQPPDVQAWAYAEATGRAWERTAGD
ncbi:MAG: DinB family protein [Dehalococcoidia bacterium]|nr:DinB family protein [Dehalococcoidia bacterium]